jgi:hypothetical protein
MATTDVYLAEQEFAARYHLGRRTVQRWRLTGDGPAWVRLGPRRVSYRLSVARSGRPPRRRTRARLGGMKHALPRQAPPRVAPPTVPVIGYAVTRGPIPR